MFIRVRACVLLCVAETNIQAGDQAKRSKCGSLLPYVDDLISLMVVVTTIR